MRLMLKFLRLSSGDRWLLVKSAILLGAIRTALWVLPFGVVRDELCTWEKAAAPKEGLDFGSIARIAWAVRASSRCVPYATCLTQALATQLLLGRLGYAAQNVGGAGRALMEGCE